MFFLSFFGAGESCVWQKRSGCSGKFRKAEILDELIAGGFASAPKISEIAAGARAKLREEVTKGTGQLQVSVIFCGEESDVGAGANAFQEWKLICVNEKTECDHAFEESVQAAIEDGFHFVRTSGDHRGERVISKRKANSDAGHNPLFEIQESGDAFSLRDDDYERAPAARGNGREEKSRCEHF